jgi:hypothetical protein
LDPISTIKYLISAGAPVDLQDIVGLTALHIATLGHAVKLDIARLLLQSGANVNHQDRYGSVAILSPMQTNSIPAVELLLEFGADLDIAEGDNVTPQSLCISCGPQVTAVFEKWKRKRAGVEAPMEEKKCGACGSRGSGEKKLLKCTRCRTILYCSKECQRTPSFCMPASPHLLTTLKRFSLENSQAKMSTVHWCIQRSGYQTVLRAGWRVQHNHALSRHSPTGDGLSHRC